jgi:hypothetical protein
MHEPQAAERQAVIDALVARAQAIHRARHRDGPERFEKCPWLMCHGMAELLTGSVDA